MSLDNDDDFDLPMEPISADDADRAIMALNKLMATTTNESLLMILEEACCEIAELMPDGDLDLDEEDEDSLAA